MKEQSVLFKTAKLAKKKGFDKTSWFGNSASLYNKKGGHEYYANYGMFGSGLSDGYIKAPTQAELQRWIWEKHSVWVSSTPQFSSNELLGVGISISSWKFPCKYVHYIGYDIYEGLEKGLQETLKFI